MHIINEDGAEEEVTEYDGDAPLKAFFRANAKDVGDYQPVFEWTLTKAGETEPMVKRYAEEIDYEFLQTGTFFIELRTTFIQGTDTLDFAMDTPFSVTITESKLEVPNAFSPNGDGMNDVLKVKEGYRSIVSFKATVFTRWGKKVYEWTDLDGGWDGRMGAVMLPMVPTS
jgi:gliding motility-associated-like protein